MLKQLQPSMSIDDQIKNLKSIGLLIPDEEYARRFLNDVSYYRLLKGFSIGLKDKRTVPKNSSIPPINIFFVAKKQ